MPGRADSAAERSAHASITVRARVGVSVPKEPECSGLKHTTSQRPTEVRVRVPASSANLGPGFDTLALALGLHDEVDVTVADDGVTVEVDGDSLVVRGERKDTRAQEGRDVRRSEVRYGAFRRAFTLPAQVAADAVSASYDAGVLTVRVAGAHTANQPTRITVTGA